jgi:hypothetical protein
VLSNYNEVRYDEQLVIVNTFRIFGWLAVELMLKNSGYSELGYLVYIHLIAMFLMFSLSTRVGKGCFTSGPKETIGPLTRVFGVYVIL